MKKTFPFLFIICYTWVQGQNNIPVSSLPGVDSIGANDFFPIVQGGHYHKAYVNQLPRGGELYPDTVVTDTITSAQILNSYTYPDTLLPMPGVGWQWNVTSIQGIYYSNETSYTAASGIGIFQGDSTTGLLPLNVSGGFINYLFGDSISVCHWFKIAIGQTGANGMFSWVYTGTTTLYNQPVTFYCPGGTNPTGGTGYFIVTLIAKKTH